MLSAITRSFANEPSDVEPDHSCIPARFVGGAVGRRKYKSDVFYAGVGGVNLVQETARRHVVMVCIHPKAKGDRGLSTVCYIATETRAARSKMRDVLAALESMVDHTFM